MAKAEPLTDYQRALRDVWDGLCKAGYEYDMNVFVVIHKLQEKERKQGLTKNLKKRVN